MHLPFLQVPRFLSAIQRETNPSSCCQAHKRGSEFWQPLETVSERKEFPRMGQSVYVFSRALVVEYLPEALTPILQRRHTLHPRLLRLHRITTSLSICSLPLLSCTPPHSPTLFSSLFHALSSCKPPPSPIPVLARLHPRLCLPLSIPPHTSTHRLLYYCMRDL
jgi:hypothetical protein